MQLTNAQGAWMRTVLGLALAVSATGLAGCLIQQPNPDINRVHKPYVPKSTFQDGKSWYLRRTLVDAPPQSWDSIGGGDWPVAERVRFEVREDMLVLYRDYEIVPGSETAEQPGADYRGTWVATFPIKEHFDIRRGYNPGTGEQTNTLEKNMDRPWFEREYMVVDWGTTNGSTTPAYYVQEHEVANPDRARFSNDYMEFTVRQSAEPYLISCWGGLSWATVPDCGAGTVDMRWSMVRVNEGEDFEPTPFPDSVQLVDDAGKQVTDSAGRAVRVPIFDKFGFFRLERITYDRDRGVTDSGRLMRAFKFNIWKKSYGPDGAPIPFAQREPKPIIYYMNAEVPEDEWSANSEALAKLTIKQANKEIGDEYNQAFRDVVQTLWGQRVLDPNFRMFELRENDCNFQHVVDFAGANNLNEALNSMGGLEAFKTAHDDTGSKCKEDPMGRQCSDSKQKFSYTLKQACTALESATENNADDQPHFEWQRIGDVRYSFAHLTSHLQSVGWLGLGMLAGDPVTGEIKNSFAYVDGPGVDYSAQTALDLVDTMNDQAEFSDLLFGTDIASYTALQNQKVGAKLRGYPDNASVAAIERRFAGLGRTPGDMLRESSGNASAVAKMENLRGTPMEHVLLNQDDLMLAAGKPTPASTEFSDQLMEAVSPARGGPAKMEEAYNARVKKAMGGKDAPCHYLREFIDDGLVGMALEIRSMPKVERWAYLRFMIYKTVMLHEVGHTLGLRHNFQGTYDGLNYSDNFFRKLEAYTQAPQAGAERVSLSVEDGITIASNAVAAGGADQAAFARDQLLLEGCRDHMLAADDRWVETCFQNDTSNNSETVKRRDCRMQVPAARAAGLIIDVNAMDCVRSHEGKSSSVMDYHGKLNGRFEGLGYYDRAALKFGYGQIVEMFVPNALKSITESSNANAVARWSASNDYKRIIDDLSNGRQGLASRRNVYRPWNATSTTWAPTAMEVPYGFCSDERAYTGGGTDVCRLRDSGGNHREQMEHDILRYKQYYFFTQFARNRLTWDLSAAINGNRTLFNNILRTFQYMYFYRAVNGPDFFATDQGRDFLGASQAGLDLYSEVLAQPEMGTFVEPVGARGFTRDSRVRGRWLLQSSEESLDMDSTQINTANNTGAGVAVPTYYFGTCDFGDTSSVNCTTGSQYPGFVCNNSICGINIELGDGRPSFLNYTNDYEDWFFTYAGNYFDKQGIILNLVQSSAYFPQLSEEGGVGSANPNVRLLNIGLASLFGDSIRHLLYSVITDQVKDYASYYRPGTGYITRSFTSLDPASRTLQPTDVAVVPRRITNLPYLALAYAMIYQSSLDDGVLDFVRVAQIGVKGEEDDIRGWDSLPPSEKVEWTHPQSGVTYRSAKVGPDPVGYELVSKAKYYGDRYLAAKECTDNPTKNDGVCSCTYVGKVYLNDLNGDGVITGDGTGSATDECPMMRPEDNLRPCETRVEPCQGPDRVDFRERAFERMEAAAERLENVRGFYQAFAQ